MSIEVHPADEHGNNRIEFNMHPDSAKLVQVPTELGKRISDLLLHKQDLEWAASFLDVYERVFEAANGDSERHVTDLALWHAALNSSMKCFSRSKARLKLDATTIFGESSEANQKRAAFDFIKSLRDKNISHDENDWSKAHPVAFLNHRGNTPKIMDVYCMVYEFHSGGPENVTRLRTVIKTALTYVREEFDAELATVQQSLEAMDYDALEALPEVSGTWPTGESVGQNRDS